MSAKDRADIALEKLGERPSAKPNAPKKTGLAIAGSVAILGLSGLGAFQGITAAHAQTLPPPPPPVQTEIVTEVDNPLENSLDLNLQMEVSPQTHVAGRQGQLLGAGKILKFDQYPGLQRGNLPEQLPGAPNFRQVQGTDVYGVAQPTVDGIRSVLDRVDAKNKTAVWTNMREEPVVYVNGRSYSLREEAHPFENSDHFKGESGDSVERTEQRLKAEILAEAKANGGRLLVHGETADGTVVAEWVKVTPESVQTTREVYQGLQDEGYKIDFARVPVTDEKTPEAKDLQAIVSRVTGADDDASFIFNCHAGRGRTTTAMVAAQLVQRAQGNGGDTAFHRMDSVRQDIREQGHYEQGNYRLILSLVQHLDSGATAKAETDQVLDQSADIQNLRTDINKYRKRSLNTEDPSSAKRAESRGLDYLHRYHTLITFNQYVKDQAPKGFELSFEQWLETKPELTKMLETFELAMTTPAQSLPGSPQGAQYA